MDPPTLEDSDYHVLTCKKHTGGIIAHNRIRVMEVVDHLVPVRNAGYSVRINNKVLTSTANARHQGDIEFDLHLNGNTPGRLPEISNIAVLCCDYYGNSFNHVNLNSTAKRASHCDLQDRATAKIRKYHAEVAVPEKTEAGRKRRMLNPIDSPTSPGQH